jgi:alanine racemase
MAVVKADAYGHGAVPVARALQDEGVRHFAVARPREGAALRGGGINGRILVLGAPHPGPLTAYAAHDLDVTVASVETAEQVCADAATHPLRVHVKVDTGMGRIGLRPRDVPEALERLARAPGVTLAGLWTHFATADVPGDAFACTQRDRFAKVLRAVQHHNVPVHAANTGALLTLNAPTGPVSPALVRTGIALYGWAATPALEKHIDLRPVLRWTAPVTHLKTVEAGTPVSYGAQWTAPRRTRIATLGVGYGDGYPRRASGRTLVCLGGALRPVVGVICMDMCMVDLGPPDRSTAQHVQVGTPAVLLGPEGPTAHDVADWAETIPYEVLCGVSPRVPRRYIPCSDPAARPSTPAASATSQTMRAVSPESRSARPTPD